MDKQTKFHVIEANIPFREFNGRSGHLMKMKVGDSFKFPVAEKQSWLSSASYLKRAHHGTISFSVREEDKIGTYRIWRVT
jgi:hypothetical protein